MASSSHYSHNQYNLAAQGHRQPGSAFKTFVLTTAVRRGINPETTTYVSKPLDLNTRDYGPWKVQTYDNTYGGAMTLLRATLRSDNTVYAQLDLDVGPKEVAKTAHMMGVTTQLDGLPAEGLGGLRIGVSPLEMADAYATLASGGIHHKPIAITKVEFPDGKTDDLGKVQGNRVMTDGQAYEVTKVLKQNIQSGTGVNANYGCPAAGKTGTTDNFTDAWFVGFEPRLATATWVGYPNASIQMRSVHGIEVAGATFPSQIWHNFMQVAHAGYCQDFPQPTTPFVSSPWYGKYSKGGAPTDSTVPYYTTTTPSPTTGGTQPPVQGKKKKNKYDPRLYEAPPQQAPTTQTPPSNNGNGNGTGQGTTAPAGTNGGGAAPPGNTVQTQG
jgi:penicillin-binding protein 1A